MKAGYNRAQKLRKRYNMSLDDFDTMLERQGGGCHICGSTTRRMVVDHDHSTNHVRGIICGHCNIALGQIGDRVETLRRMIDYLNGG